ncbi:hypothetical protein L1049_023665 [Liquidambar formosana]|uniref:PIN-like protein n=1 Tax=Liquidambar formosana TaxID=63359 RepID=A0AAP0RZF3_LIQFO
MPFNILLTFIIGSALGYVLIKITRAPQDLQGLVLGCCAAGNLGNLLLIIIPSICREKGSPFGANDVCYTHGLAYASLSMAIGAIYLWSYVYNTVRIYSNKSTEGAKTNESTINTKSFRETSVNLSKCCTGPLLPSEDCLMVEANSDPFQLPCTISEGKSKIVGFIAGTIPQFRKAMIGDSAPLRVVQDSAPLLGDASIPTVTLIVGANLLKGNHLSEFDFSHGYLGCHLFTLPILGVVSVKSAVLSGLVQSDPLYQFVLLLQFAVPPAMNIGTITQLFGAGESECSVILLWTYALAPVPLTIWSTIFMWLVA